MGEHALVSIVAQTFCSSQVVRVQGTHRGHHALEVIIRPCVRARDIMSLSVEFTVTRVMASATATAPTADHDSRLCIHDWSSGSRCRQAVISQREPELPQGTSYHGDAY